MVTILREADEKSVPEVAKKHGVSSQTIYGWRKHFGSLEPADIKRLRQLESVVDPTGEFAGLVLPLAGCVGGAIGNPIGMRLGGRKPTPWDIFVLIER
jgi:hypothetical protein